MWLGSKKMLILQILTDDCGWMTGRELIEASDGELWAGNVYVHLCVLRKDLGYIRRRERQRENAPPCFEYQIIGMGRRALNRRRRWRKWYNIFLPELA
ncbi:MAG: hypothetical protein CO030_00750 [Candidatus Magasanikbacteria bacterium CG_4_9_14_0_2_um_filter_42_11]|uniref:Transcription regulator PadR N-terminal domain-containing protein n=1 Tax=Candidatus Magasanikbacteria bacterium CG_4_9_14_0_2_um_filter_42_11 TaxID=1974643 RepID=A0A2M8FAS5_9BACT|nr:MAG: hypothetical protein COU34_03865 [Candidatus Magasanikbacteria bacterium CG10_big_fil_rev_8_21_14_0_10_43_9]PIY92432.1 MAG: hypothetical protein COY70_03300 [Candidatus Magasanikbacteria bacterium CG_4_10_14_0_8_um_filter_42_12]PJC52844.1 MAG: hypothetical protein CO030_00750 [Candidatus Magasanikbacteria bacterium CG_4_9_14_0_2_um_filter_42_11]